MGVLLFLATSLILMLSMSPSPLKMSLFLTYISICMSLFSYKITNSMFTPMVVMISFSSGMMILFSYCSVMCLYKEKSFQSKTILILMSIIIMCSTMLSTSSNSYSTPVMKSMMETINYPSLMFLMFVVILAMVGINTSFFNPTKKFLQSY